MFRWARDNSGFYAVALFSSHPTFYTASIALLYFYDLASASHTKVDLQWENGLGFGGLEITPDGLIASVVSGVRHLPARFTKGGQSWRRA